MTRSKAGIDLRLGAAITASRVARLVIRQLGRGGGTSAPGLVAQKLDPAVLGKLGGRLEHGTIVVAGTNGKTTTSRMIADMLELAGYGVIHNRSGSNLVRGVINVLADRSDWFGRPQGSIGVIEADEAAFPELVANLRPRVILLNNLFRDQLDRYGELDTVARKWRTALERLDASTTLIVNADDPSLMAVTDNLPSPRVTFGMKLADHRLAALPHAADSSTCRVCGADLSYDALYVSHLGDWHCPNCGRQRPDLDVSGHDLQLNGMESLDMTVETAAGRTSLKVGLPGLYNAYNAVAAITAGQVLEVPMPVMHDSLAAFSAAFGRLERATWQGRHLTMILVKNPVGFNEVLRMLTSATGEVSDPVLIAINDLDADGRDVSWLWDVDFELLAGGQQRIATTGIRGTDMTNRLKYAGVAQERLQSLPAATGTALDQWVQELPEGSSGIILPTYTAMLDIRKVLAAAGALDAFWKQ